MLYTLSVFMFLLSAGLETLHKEYSNTLFCRLFFVFYTYVLRPSPLVSSCVLRLQYKLDFRVMCQEFWYVLLKLLNVATIFTIPASGLVKKTTCFPPLPLTYVPTSATLGQVVALRDQIDSFVTAQKIQCSHVLGSKT